MKDRLYARKYVCRATGSIHLGLINIRKGYVDIDDGRRISVETAHTIFKPYNKRRKPSWNIKTLKTCPICYTQYEGHACHACTYNPREVNNG